MSIVQVWALTDSIKNTFWLFCILVCGIFSCLNIKSVLKTKCWGIVSFLTIVMISAFINHYPDNMNGIRNTLFFVFSVLFATLSITVICKRRGIISVSKIVFQILFVLCIINTVSVILVGPGDYAGSNVYFIGNKFNTVYLNILLLFFRVISSGRLDSIHEKLKITLLWLFAFIEALFVTGYTGLIMLIVIAVMYLFNYKFIGATYLKGFRRVIKKPCFIICLVIISGMVAFALEAIMQLGIIKNLLNYIGKSQTMGSRLIIYTYLWKIILGKPWLGYGYDTNIVTTTYAANAQNGLLKIIIENGFIGCVAFLILVRSLISKSQSVKNAKEWYALFTIYAFIVSSIVEINYSSYFILILVMFSLLTDLDVEKADNIIYEDLTAKI